jgi:hypothetical protein
MLGVFSVGRIINPVTVRSQLIGASCEWVATYAPDCGRIGRAPLRADCLISAVAGGKGDLGVSGGGAANDRGSDRYEVLSHIDYAVRYWPAQQEGPFNPRIFEDAFRQSMRDLAGSGRALELNVGGPLRPWIPQWWSEEGGRAITLASDAHTTDALANNFFEAMATAEHFGFRQGRQPEDFWTR